MSIEGRLAAIRSRIKARLHQRLEVLWPSAGTDVEVAGALAIAARLADLEREDGADLETVLSGLPGTLADATRQALVDLLEEVGT